MRDRPKRSTGGAGPHRGGNRRPPQGRESGPNPPRRPSAAPVAKKRAAPAGTHACPECGKMFRTDEAVQTHRHAAHGTAEMVVGNMSRCPDCGSLVKNSHMARHRSIQHGEL